MRRTEFLGCKVSTIQTRSDGMLVLARLSSRSDNMNEGYTISFNLDDMQRVPNNDGSATVFPSETFVWYFVI